MKYMEISLCYRVPFDSVAGIATGYGLDRPSVNPRWSKRYSLHQNSTRHFTETSPASS